MAAALLNTACSDGEVDKAQELLSSDWKPAQRELDEALLKATLKGYATIAALLLSSGARITRPTFLTAARNKDIPIFQEFINHGWDINSTEFGGPALRLIVQDEACVRWFLDRGADPNKQSDRGFTPLASAALYPSTTVIELLISHGAKLDPDALVSAIDHRGRGGLPVMRCLIDRGIDVNAPLQSHGSPLHFAVYVAGPNQTRLLLDRGADRSIKNLLGKTPLEMARSKMNSSENAKKVYEILSE